MAREITERFHVMNPVEAAVGRNIPTNIKANTVTVTMDECPRHMESRVRVCLHNPRAAALERCFERYIEYQRTTRSDVYGISPAQETFRDVERYMIERHMATLGGALGPTERLNQVNTYYGIDHARREGPVARSPRHENSRGRLPQNIRALVDDILRFVGWAESTRTDIVQMANDKLEPMLWAAFYNRYPETVAHSGQCRDYALGDSIRGYSRTKAAKTISRFQEVANLKKANWKFLCNQDTHYLIALFSMTHGHNIYWPAQILNHVAHGERNTMSFVAYDLVRKIFDRRDHVEEHNRIEPREFGYVMRDLHELNGVAISNITAKVSTWAELRATLARLEQEHHRNNQRNRHHISNAMYHFARGDMHGIEFRVAGMNDMSYEPPKPHETKEYAVVAHLPKVIVADTPRPEFENEFEGMKAILIDTNMKHYAEGTGMRHCLWRLYQAQMSRGDYAAYHIVDPKSPQGWTAGFRKQRYAQLNDANVIITRWSHDQTRGVRNEIPRNVAIEAMAGIILQRINEAEDAQRSNSCVTEKDEANSPEPVIQVQRDVACGEPRIMDPFRLHVQRVGMGSIRNLDRIVRIATTTDT